MTYSNANFTPGLKGYSDIKPFRFWCQKVLPLVYDDSLSYYELLCKVVDYLNNVISDLSATEDNVGELLDAYNQLQDYVNNYFTNLDVQEEINNKLDAMFEDGTIPTMIEEYVHPFIEDLNDHYAELDNQINETMETQNENIATLTARVNNLVINNTTNLTGYNVVTAESTTAQGGSTVTENIPKDAEILQVCYSGYNDTNYIIKSDNISYESTPNVPSSTQQQVVVTITDATDTRFNVFITYAISQTIDIAELTDIRTGYDNTVYPSAGDAVRGQVSDLNNVLVSKKGENQVTPQNIEGMQFTKTTDEVEGDNIFSESYLGENGFYVSVDTTVTPPKIAHSSISDYRWYAIPVDGESKYRFTEARFACLAKGNTVGSEAIGTNNVYATELTTTGASYLFLSYLTSITDIEVHKVTTETIYSDFILPDWMVDNLPIPAVVEKPKFATVTGNIASGGNLQLTAPRNNLRKGERIVFEGNITSFSSLKIGLTYSTSLDATQQENTFVIDGTNISYYAWSTATPVTVAHGLTLSNNIQIIWEMSAEASLKFTLISNGDMFAHVFTNFTRQVIGNPFVLSIGTVLTDCKLTWTCNDIDKDIWMFGDSYFAYSANRWTYYLHQYGYDQNCLLDGFPGEGGVNGRVSFNNLLQYGTPKFAVWCLGMNDGSDSNSAPSANWVSSRDYFLQYCTDNNITPVFGTIPTVPSINNEQKNAWIRSSGYRYIDFAKAVGANASGVWYSGMLSRDDIHPSESGAKALFAQVLIDLPEIMIGN